jgi:hypothetical protein
MTKKNEKIKKTPLRRCVGCYEMKDKKQLTRVVRDDSGDAKGKVSGRGAYICPGKACFAKARKSRALERHLGVAIAPEVFDSLEAAIDGP